jgi:hypothetical protein
MDAQDDLKYSARCDDRIQQFVGGAQLRMRNIVALIQAVQRRRNEVAYHSHLRQHY